METKEIFESGFVEAFINQYFEEKSHDIETIEKDKLLYQLCESNEEKIKITNQQKNEVKNRIPKYGFEVLSNGYLSSCNTLSHEYISDSVRDEFWIKRFIEEFYSCFNEFNPITQALYTYYNTTELSVEMFENEDEFWSNYPKALTPKTQNVLSAISGELDLAEIIEYDIIQFKENQYWEFDFDEYENYLEMSKPIELLLNLSKLLVELSRLELFNEFSRIEKTNTPIPIASKQLTQTKNIKTEKPTKQLKSFSDFKGIEQINQFYEHNTKIEFMNLTVSQQKPFGIVLEPLVMELPKLFQDFKSQLFEMLDGKSVEQTFNIKKSLENDCMPVIEKYLNWYEVNTDETKNHFPTNNPYELFYNDVKCFKNEILKYYPHLENPLPQQLNEQPKNENSKRNDSEEKTLASIITHENNIKIVTEIKIKYKNIKGKRLKILLLALQDLELLPNDRIALQFYTSCKNEFDWKIASYNAMNGYKYCESIDKDELNKMKDFIKPLMKITK